MTSQVCEIGNSILQQDGKDHADLSELMVREEDLEKEGEENDNNNDNDNDNEFVDNEKEK